MTPIDMGLGADFKTVSKFCYPTAARSPIGRVFFLTDFIQAPKSSTYLKSVARAWKKSIQQQIRKSLSIFTTRIR